MNKHSAPCLRFAGFAGEWEEKKLEDFSPLQRGFDLPVSKIVEGDYPVVFSNGILKTHNQYKVKGVGVVTGRSGTIGEVTFVEKDFWPHNTALWVTNFFDNDPQFVFQFLKNFDLSRFATGSGVPTLNRNDVHDQIVYAPKREEQTALGDFFRRLDETLAQARARLAKTQQLKRAMLAKLFPQHGETAPKLRFKGFSGDWERKMLGENASFTKGRGYSKSDLTNEGFPIILYGRLYTQYENIINNVDTFVSYDQNALKSFGNEVIVPASGETAEDIARASAVIQKGVILGGDLNVITPNNDISPPFLAVALTNGKSSKELAKKAQGKSVVHLRNDDLKACEIYFPPTFEEQTTIGNFFQKLDQTLALQTAELEKLTALKKALLAAMLV